MVTEIKQFVTPPVEQADNEADAYQRQFHSILEKDVSIVILPIVIPAEILVGSLRDGRLRVYSPITVKFTTEGQYVIAEAVDFNEFGFGENPSGALMDLQRTIVELYFTLEQEQGHLGDEMHRVWLALKQKINKR